MATEKYTPRLKSDYQARIRAELKTKFGYTNEMQIPKLDKIVLNMGIGEAVADSKKANAAPQGSDGYRWSEGCRHQGSQLDRRLQAA